MVGALLITGMLLPVRPASSADELLPVITRQKSVELAGNTILSLKAKCPSRMRVISGGVMAPETDATMVIDSYPIDGTDADRKPDDGWKATMHNLGATPTQMTVLAVCTAKGRFRYFKKTDTALPGESTSVTVDCPVNADQNRHTSVTGGGVRYSKRSPSQSLAATASEDGPDESGTRDDAWRVAVNNDTADQNLPMTAYAICETSLQPAIFLGSGSAHTVAPAAPNGPTRTETLDCQAYKVVGGGVRLDPQNNAGYIEFTGPTVPNPGERPNGWTSQITNPGTSSTAWFNPLCSA